jgi:hypothetical protein
LEMKLSAHVLIDELLADPAKFIEQGKPEELFQAYSRGWYPLHTLHPLLASENHLVRHEAAWIASELGRWGCPLLHHVIPLIDSGDRYLKYQALNVAILCSVGNNVKEFVHVARCLDDSDEVIRVLAMRFVTNADQSQLQAGLIAAGGDGALGIAHRTGLERLSKYDALELEDVEVMLADRDPLTRRYGAIAAKRLMKKWPELIDAAATVPDQDVSRFAREAIEDAEMIRKGRIVDID